MAENELGTAVKCTTVNIVEESEWRRERVEGREE